MKNRCRMVGAAVAVLFAVAPCPAKEDGAAALDELRHLTSPPATYPADGFTDDQGVRALFFENIPWRGKATRVFARMSLPAGAAADAKVPGIVLVHGGGGTAYAEWVRRWNEHGFAAISIAVEGQTDERDPAGPRGAQWKRHAWGGPARVGIYGDSAEPLRDQWMYHAVAATIRANALLRARPEVDAAKIGLMGISWGGVITSTAIGLDRRFAFAIPTYGCGDLASADNQYGRALGANEIYRDIWNPLLRLGAATMPVLWYSWPGDEHFPLDAQARCYRAAPGPRMVVLRPGMKHSHPAGWIPPDSYAFAESVVRRARPWLQQTAIAVEQGRARVEFRSDQPLDSAVLIWTADRGFTGHREWHEAPAVWRHDGDRWSVAAELPPATSAWFINVHSGKLLGSSDFQEMVPREPLAGAAAPRAEKVVVLTFDDSSASHHAIAAPLLKRYGFGATFFITEGFTFRTNKRDYMTWEQIAELHRDGFEIGNHTRDHLGVTESTVPRLAEQLETIAARCREHGIPTPVSFAWPGNRFHVSALPVLQRAGIRFARRGGEPEVPYALGGGVAYEPGADHPLLVPTAGDARPDWTLENLKRAVALGVGGRIPVLQFHGVPDGEHPWVNTPRERFEEYMAWLHREGFTVIALRDLAQYTEGKPVPADPLAIMETRRRAAAAAPVFSSDKELIDLWDVANVRARRPLLIAHRGGVVTARIPEGSLAAIREAARFGYDLVELDVRATKDGVPLIFHDPDLLAATGRAGAIGELSEAEARAARFRQNDEPIATLEQALVLCRQLHLGVMLDLKDPPRLEMLRKMAALVRKHGLEKSTLTISAHPLVRSELAGVALVPVSADELEKIEAGETIPLGGRHWFGIPAWIAFDRIPKLQRAGALVFPAINLFRYENDPGRAQARRDVQALSALGVEGFQIDSAYQDFFGKPPP